MLVTVPIALELPIAIVCSTAFVGTAAASWIWGVLFLYAEGRRTTEVLLSCLNLVVVLGSSFSRFVGQAARGPFEDHIMPFAVALSAAPLALGCLCLLDVLPGPSESE